jgi:hypothetical protein
MSDLRNLIIGAMLDALDDNMLAKHHSDIEQMADEALAAVAPLIRRAALEEAARVAVTAAISWESDAPECKSHLAERECLASAEAAQSIAAAIRALDT